MSGNRISNLSPLKGLTNLEWLIIRDTGTSDVSPLAGLTNLRVLHAHRNNISDITALAKLTNLQKLEIQENNISDFSPITDLRKNLRIFHWHGNPGYPDKWTMIEASWLWLHIPNNNMEGQFETDLLSKASEGKITEIAVATHGATEGKAVGDHKWTKHELPIGIEDNIKTMLGNMSLHGVAYGNILIHSPIEQYTFMSYRAVQRLKVWLNGALVFQRNYRVEENTDVSFFPVTLQPGKNVLLFATDQHRAELSTAVLGFVDTAQYTVIDPAVSYSLTRVPIHVDDTFTMDIVAEGVFELAGWQFDLAFDPAVLEVEGVREGDFLKSDGGATFFQSGRIDNSAGKITGLIAGRISEGGASGSGSLLQVEFTAISEGETELALENFEFGSITGANIPASPLEIRITVEERLVTGDVNRDGRVSILDLILVAQQLGKRVAAGSPVDINADGIVNIFDLTLVAQGIVGAAAPAVATGRVDAATLEAWIAEARLADDGSIVFQQGIANLQSLLTTLIIPEETALHANYPNPFNPETWIPYQLATPSEVTLTLYDMSGGVVRRLEVGHQAAGTYQSRNRALYWDGRNRDGEPLASGLYFYTLRAGEFTATRRMLIRK